MNLKKNKPLCRIVENSRDFPGLRRRGKPPPPLKIISTPDAARKYFEKARLAGKSVGLVPTMGALHAGHASLIKKARRENAVAAVSIFVNPTQFCPGEDFAKYPRAFARDRRLCAAAGADVIFRPSAAAMYPEGFSTSVSVGKIGRVLCGVSRPGHFDGVVTVVSKLFDIVRPSRAYFGEKDYQQLKIIERFACGLNLPVKIIPCPTVREKDGLAMSSRNAYLRPPERKSAAAVYRILSSAKKNPLAFAASPVSRSRPPVASRAPTFPAASSADGSANSRVTPRALEKKIFAALGKIPSARAEYVALVGADTLAPLKKIPSDPAKYRILAAVRLGKTRLIDNV